VRRARLFYLRDAIGQKARIKEKKLIRTANLVEAEPA
jgi:hypothetical protein